MQHRVFAVSAAVRVLLLAAVAGALLLSACGSSSNGASTAPTPTSPGPETTVSPNSTCPFSGSTASQSQPGASGSTALNKVTPSPAGCIDNVTFAFAPTLAPSVTAYESTPSSGSGAVLVVTLQHATLGGGLAPGTSNPTNVSYVSQVKLTSASGNVVLYVTLDKKRPFLVSSSQMPAQLVLSIG